MKHKTIGETALTFYNSGYSRSRITLITTHGQADNPQQLAGLRWIVFGDDAANALHNLIYTHSWPKLHDLIPGGLNSTTWQHLRASWQFLPPERAAWHALEFLNFGQGNSRVLLLQDTSRAPTLTPERIDGTSIIALSSHASQHFRTLLISLPGNTTNAYAAAADIIPGGLSGRSIHRSRHYLAAVQRPAASR